MVLVRRRVRGGGAGLIDNDGEGKAKRGAGHERLVCVALTELMMVLVAFSSALVTLRTTALASSAFDSACKQEQQQQRTASMSGTGHAVIHGGRKAVWGLEQGAWS